MRNITRKQTLTTGIVCLLAVAALWTGSAFVIGAVRADSQSISVGQSAGTVNVAPSKDAVGGEVMHIKQNGADVYSTDGGQTWSRDLPDGFSLGADGNLQKNK